MVMEGSSDPRRKPLDDSCIQYKELKQKNKSLTYERQGKEYSRGKSRKHKINKFDNSIKTYYREKIDDHVWVHRDDVFFGLTTRLRYLKKCNLLDECIRMMRYEDASVDTSYRALWQEIEVLSNEKLGWDITIQQRQEFFKY